MRTLPLASYPSLNLVALSALQQQHALAAASVVAEKAAGQPGVPATVRYVAAKLPRSFSVAHKYLRDAEAAGLIRRASPPLEGWFPADQPALCGACGQPLVAAS